MAVSQCLYLFSSLPKVLSPELRGAAERARGETQPRAVGQASQSGCALSGAVSKLPKALISTVLLGPQAPRSPGKPCSPVSPAAPTMHLHAAGSTTYEPAMALPWAAAGSLPPSPTIILDTMAPFQILLSPQLNHSFIHFFRKGHVHRLRAMAQAGLRDGMVLLHLQKLTVRWGRQRQAHTLRAWQEGMGTT